MIFLLCIFHKIVLMNNFLIWNIRGVGNAPSIRRLKKLVSTNEVVFFTILEPKIYNEDILAYENKLRCTGSLSNPQNTIWIFWKDINCQAIVVEEQYITVSIQIASSVIHLTSIYASCDGRKRRELWAKLINDNLTFEWIVAGDFNVVSTPR